MLLPKWNSGIKIQICLVVNIFLNKYTKNAKINAYHGQKGYAFPTSRSSLEPL